MKRGIIIEIDDRFLTLLTPDGEFLRARRLNLDYEISQEIDFIPIRTKPLFSMSSVQMRAALVASIFLIAAILLPFYNANKVYAYMTFDMSPSLEIGVNKNMDVIELAPNNDKGEIIISELEDWKRKDLSTVMKLILMKSIEQNYMDKRDQVLIATVHEGDRKEEIDDKLEDNIKEIKAVLEKENLQLKVVEGTVEDRMTAKQQGLSTGKYIEIKQQESINKKETTEKEKKSESSKQKENEAKKGKPNHSDTHPSNNGKGNNRENKHPNRENRFQENPGKSKGQNPKQNPNMKEPPGQAKKNQQSNGNRNKDNKGNEGKGQNKQNQPNNNPAKDR